MAHWRLGFLSNFGLNLPIYHCSIVFNDFQWCWYFSFFKLWYKVVIYFFGFMFLFIIKLQYLSLFAHSQHRVVSARQFQLLPHDIILNKSLCSKYKKMKGSHSRLSVRPVLIAKKKASISIAKSQLSIVYLR